MPKVKNTYWFVWLMVAFLYFLVMVFGVNKFWAQLNPEPIGVTKGMVSFCQSPEISQTAECLINLTSSFYKYKDTPDSKKVTIDELMQDGGDCAVWSKFYAESGKLLGYNTKIVTLKMSGNIYHQYAVLSDRTGYCIMDNKLYVCGIVG